MKDIILHTMEYTGNVVESVDQLVNFYTDVYDGYKRVYEDCFHQMREDLELFPVDNCYSLHGCLEKREYIYILFEENLLVGSVAIYGNEIDDLIVDKEYQHRGYGLRLLRYAISRMQKDGVSPIILKVADWNVRAIDIYKKVGFEIVGTEIINRRD